MPRTVTQYYTSLKHFDALYDRIGRKMPAPTDSLESLKAWQKEARAKLSQLLGLDLMEKCPLEPELYDSWDEGNYRVERVRIQSAPGLFIPLIVLVPKDIAPGEKRPAFMHCFGHGSPRSMLDSFNFERGTPREKKMTGQIGIAAPGCMKLAQQGYLVVAFDSRGSGERLDFAGVKGEFSDIGADNPLNNVASALGGSKLGFEVWDMMRAVDYIFSRDDSNGHIGTGGTSGGGHQSLFFAAMDERVDLILTSTWFYGFKESLIHLPHNCSCNFIPGLFKYFDACDIGSLIAPRAFQVEAGSGDHLNGHMTMLGNMRKSWAITKKSYDLFEQSDKLWLYVFDGGHGYPGGWQNPDPVAAPSGGKMIEFVNKYMPLSGKGGDD